MLNEFVDKKKEKSLKRPFGRDEGLRQTSHELYYVIQLSEITINFYGKWKKKNQKINFGYGWT